MPYFGFGAQFLYTDQVMKKAFENYKPAVRRHWLIFAAGIMWLGVGIGLTAAACFWLYRSSWPLNLILAAVSLVLGIIVYSFGFSRIVRKNLFRIGDKPDLVCLFAFQGRRSYFLILVMILMGYTIRHSPVPKDIDAVVYFTMGSALILGGMLYFRTFIAGKRRVSDVGYRVSGVRRTDTFYQVRNLFKLLTK